MKLSCNWAKSRRSVDKSSARIWWTLHFFSFVSNALYSIKRLDKIIKMIDYRDYTALVKLEHGMENNYLTVLTAGKFRMRSSQAKHMLAWLFTSFKFGLILSSSYIFPARVVIGITTILGGLVIRLQFPPCFFLLSSKYHW